MSAAHVAAIVARIAGTGPQALAVYDSRLPASPTYPYVIVYADGGVKSSDREADERIQHLQGFQTTTVGASAAYTFTMAFDIAGKPRLWRPKDVTRCLTIATAITGARG